MHSVKVFRHCWRISHGKAEAIYSWQIANIAKGKFNDISVISGGNMWFTVAVELIYVEVGLR